MLFQRKKRDELHSGDILLAEGIYLKKPVMEQGHFVKDAFFRSLIVVLLTFGSVGGFLSAFSLSYNYVVVLIAYLLLAMYFSFLYATGRLIYRDLGYIAFFAVFVFSIFQLRNYANSGLYVIVNSFLQHAKTFFDLPGVREYELRVENNYLTLTIFSIFIGMVIIILLNIWLYSSMSIGWTLLFTFSWFYIPLYIKLTPEPIYIMCLAIGYACVLMWKPNGHYRVYSKKDAFHIKGWKKNHITYVKDIKVVRQVLLSGVVMMFVMVTLIRGIVPPATFQGYFKKDPMREATAETIGNFVLLGFSGLMNRYVSTGGMSGGKLGGISNVRPDYLTDLVVSYTPYSNEAVYLKGFTGGSYEGDQWTSIYYDLQGTKTNADIFAEDSMKAQADILGQQFMGHEEYTAFASMDVKNVGADTAYLYYPYYTTFVDYSIYNNSNPYLQSAQGLGYDETASYSYYPKIRWEKNMGVTSPSSIDTSQIDAVYLEVPDTNVEVIDAVCKEIGLSESMSTNEIIQRVDDYFWDNIPYTLKPGATPRGADFVNYFLTENRKGYCAHFASSATLIFRHMGIPARYVEGYAFNMETALDAELNEEKEYSNYYHGYSALGESAVVDVEVTDAMAHAWVEVYIKDFGWKVVEVTPGSNEATDEDDFWSAFSNLLEDEADLDFDGGSPWDDLNLMDYVWILYVLLSLVALMAGIAVVRILIRKGIRYRNCHQENIQEALIARYCNLCECILICDERFVQCRSHREQLHFMAGMLRVSIEELELQVTLEEISFSTHTVSQDRLSVVEEQIAKLQSEVWKYANFKQKCKLILR